MFRHPSKFIQVIQLTIHTVSCSVKELSSHPTLTHEHDSQVLQVSFLVSIVHLVYDVNVDDDCSLKVSLMVMRVTSVHYGI
jgi:hypothetical protein